MDKIYTLTDEVYTEFGCTEPLTRAYIQIALYDILTFDRKQHDYGPENITAFGEKGVVVRMNDKMARLRNLVWGDKPASNEAIEDSYTDLSVYGVIGRMCRAGTWPGVGVAVPNPPEHTPDNVSAYCEVCTPEARPLEPAHREDTPPGDRYWCHACQLLQLTEKQAGGFCCMVCHQFLFGPGLGSVREY